MQNHSLVQPLFDDHLDIVGDIHGEIEARRIAWAWIWGNLGVCLKIRPVLERIDVRSNWKKTWNDGLPGLAYFEQLCQNHHELEETVW